MNIIDAMMVNLHLESVDAAGFQRAVEAELHGRCDLPQMPGERSIELRIVGLDTARMAFLRTDRPFTLAFAEQGEALFCVIAISGGIAVAQDGRAPVSCRRGDAFALATASAWQASAEAGAHLCILAFQKADAGRLLERFTGRAPGEALDIAAPFRSATASGRMLAALVAGAVAGAGGEASLAASPHTAEALRDAMIALLLENLPHNHAAAITNQRAEAAPWPVRKAIDFIVANARREISVGEVAAAADLSLRTLQQSFQRVLKASPQDYIKTVRLQCVRRELLDPASRRSIEEIAGAWGFMNRGHFATQYRKLYGERPSDTRRSR